MRGENVLVTHLPEHLRDQITLEELHNRISQLDIPQNSKIILSACQIEFNYSRKPYKIIEDQLIDVLDLLFQKKAESIILLFPLLKPRISSEPLVKISRYIDFKEMFTRATADPRIKFVQSPSMQFLETELISRGGKQFLRPKIGPHGEILPVRQRFHFVPILRRFFPSISQYKETEKLIEAELKRIEKAALFKTDHQDRNIEGDTKRLFEPKTAPYIHPGDKEPEIELGDKPPPPMMVSTSNPESITPEVELITAQIPPLMSLASETPSPPQIYQNIQLDPLTTAELTMDNTLSSLMAGNIEEQIEEPTTSRSARKRRRRREKRSKTPIPPASPPKPFRHLQDPENLKESTMAQLLRPATIDPACIVGVAVGPKFISLQLDTGAILSIISQPVIDILTTYAPKDLSYIELKQQISLTLADSKTIAIAKHCVEIRLMLGNREINIPFYIIDSAEKVFIMGRLSMDYWKISLNLHERKLICNFDPEHPMEICFISTEGMFKPTLCSAKTNLQIENLNETIATVEEAELSIFEMIQSMETDQDFFTIKNFQEGIWELDLPSSFENIDIEPNCTKKSVNNSKIYEFKTFPYRYNSYTKVPNYLLDTFMRNKINNCKIAHEQRAIRRKNYFFRKQSTMRYSGARASVFDTPPTTPPVNTTLGTLEQLHQLADALEILKMEAESGPYTKDKKNTRKRLHSSNQ
ncbi:unnamed protein product [Allacma fusca]|uniref:Uncharacterized protein n=1 Tax=Allacma fusca TaxID=39272 RepID=A0A8J2PK01_9HEXA|nr:unnamed protein product [Allacma fusca]